MCMTTIRATLTYKVLTSRPINVLIKDQVNFLGNVSNALTYTIRTWLALALKSDIFLKKI